MSIAEKPFRTSLRRTALGLLVVVGGLGGLPAHATGVSIDLTPPSVISASPVDDATGVKRGTTVTATFDEALDGASVNQGSLQLACGGSAIAGTVSYTVTAPAQITFTPAAPLPSFRDCTATIPADGVRNEAQLGNVGATSWTFRTAMVNRTVTAAKAGGGAGTVMGAGTMPPLSGSFSIDCGSKCSAKVLAGNPYLLDAVAEPGSMFTKWVGCPQPSGDRCTIPAVERDRTVTARFAIDPNVPRIAITNANPASGNVTLLAPTVDATIVNATSNRIIINAAGSHTITINYNSATDVVGSVLFRWNTESVVARCPTLPCGVTVNSTTRKVRFTNTVLPGLTDATVTATLNGSVPFTVPEVSWAAHSSPTGKVLTSLVYGNNTFVAVGMIQAILTSTDGLAWTARTGPDNNYYTLNGVTFDGTQFIAVGDKIYGVAADPVILTSPDGVTWTRRDWAPDYEVALADVAAGGGRITAVGMNGFVTTSTDGGVTWTNETVPAGANIASFTAIAANTTTRVAVGRSSGYKGGIIVNSGTGWNVAMADIPDFLPRDVTWTGEQFVAVGADAANFGAGGVVMTSPDGVDWTRRAVPTTEMPAGYAFRAVMGDAMKIYATGDNQQSAHVILSSANGVDWKQEFAGTTVGQGQLSGIAASASRIVTVGGTKSITKP